MFSWSTGHDDDDGDVAASASASTAFSVDFEMYPLEFDGEGCDVAVDVSLRCFGLCCDMNASICSFDIFSWSTGHPSARATDKNDPIETMRAKGQ